MRATITTHVSTAFGAMQRSPAATSRATAAAFTMLCATVWSILMVAAVAVAPAQAEVVVIKSDDLPQYDAPISAFETAVGAPVQVIDIRGSRDTGEKLLRRLAEGPDIDGVFALGSQAAYLTRKELPRVPMVFAMVLNWQRYALGGPTSGIAVEMPVDALLTRFRLLLPGLTRIGLIHSSKTSAATLETARTTAASLNIELVEEDVVYSDDVGGAYRRMHGRIDALWMLPDPVVVTRDNFRYLSARTRSDGVAFLAFSENFVRAGALLSIGPHYETMGSQAAVLLEQLMRSEPPPPVQPPLGSTLAINADTADAIGVDLDPGTLGIADLVVEER
jgi:putative ABC transport system substrate-binding protein